MSPAFIAGTPVWIEARSKIRSSSNSYLSGCGGLKRNEAWKTPLPGAGNHRLIFHVQFMGNSDGAFHLQPNTAAFSQ
jgi:hypothetical protein